MYIYAIGDINGEWNNIFKSIDLKIQETNVRPNLILFTGSMGIWPNPNRKDRASRKLNSGNEFIELYNKNTPLPCPSFFVPGTHEDHYWMQKAYLKGMLEILPNMYWTVPGVKFPIGPLSLMGLGKVYSPITYNTVSNLNRRQIEKSFKHYTKSQIDKCLTHSNVDILLTHQAGENINLGNIVSRSLGINDICNIVKPKLHIHGHYNYSSYYRNPISSTPTLSLAFNEIKIIQYKNNQFLFGKDTSNKNF